MTGPPFLLGPMERVLHLRTLPALESLPPTLLVAIAQHAQERFFPGGDILLDSRRAPDAVYVVVEGRVAVERTGGRPGQVHVGGTLGFLEFLARLERGITARALTDTVTLELGWDALLEVCERHFLVLHAYLRFLARQLVLEMKRSPSPFGSAPDDNRGPVPERELDLVERALALGGAEAFSATSMDAIVELARHVDEVRYDPNQGLWRHGDEAEDFLLITRGTVRCTRGHRFDCNAGPRLALGMHEALCGRPRWHDAEAVTPVRGLRIDTEPFLDILEDHYELAVDVMARLATRLIALSDRRLDAAPADGSPSP